MEENMITAPFEAIRYVTKKYNGETDCRGKLICKFLQRAVIAKYR